MLAVKLSIEKNNTIIMVVLCKIQCTNQNFLNESKLLWYSGTKLHGI